MFFLELFEVLSRFERTILQEKEEQVLGFSFQFCSITLIWQGIIWLDNIHNY